MVEVALVLTLATVLIIVGLIGVARWLVPRALADEAEAEVPAVETEEPSNPV